MKNKEEQQFDDFFKKKLEQNAPIPPFDNWEKVASNLESDSLDEFMKNHLDTIHPTPNPKIWNGIKRKLPLSLLVRNQLNRLSRIAAALIVFMIVMLVWNKDKKNPPPIDDKTTVAEVFTLQVEKTKEPVDFVFVINENPNQNTISASEELFLEDDKTNENLLTGLMENEEDFNAGVNEEIIKKSLLPLLESPVENLEAALPHQMEPFPTGFFDNEYSTDEK